MWVKPVVCCKNSWVFKCKWEATNLQTMSQTRGWSSYTSKMNAVMSVAVWCVINHPRSLHNAQRLQFCWTCTTFCVVSYGDRGSLTRSRRMQFFRGKRCNCGPLRHTDVFWIHYAAHISKYLQIGFTPELPQLIYAYILYTAIQYVNGATFSWLCFFSH